MIEKTDEYYMQIALSLAKKASLKGEVPVGAVIVKDGKILSKAYNKKNKKKNALYHAEMIAIYRASRKIKDFRLNGATMYVTLEPCCMCSGAILSSRISRLVYACWDENLGCAGSRCNLFKEDLLYHHTEVVGGVLEKDSRNLIKEFFRKIRKKKES